MMDRLLSLAKRNGELQKTDPRSEVDLLGAALAELAAERGVATNAIEAAAGQREQLLLEAGSDAKLDALDRDIERAQRVLLRCDRIEPLLLRQLNDRRQAFRRQHFEALTERYRGAVAEYTTVLRRALELKREIAGIRASGERAGFDEARTLFDLPYLQCSDPDHFEYAVSAQLTSVRLEPQAELTPIRFVRSCGVYRAGETAGFGAEDADAYIRAGVGERVTTEVSP